jgi:hypothetical protein
VPNHDSLLTDWLADAGLRAPLEDMVDGFSRRLNDLGVPVARTFAGGIRCTSWCACAA